MKSNKCSQCGLVNFAGAPQCKRCGAPLVVERDQNVFDGDGTGNLTYSAARASHATTPNRTLRESLLENSGFQQIIFGLICIGAGSLLTYYSNNIFYGAIIFGVVAALKGVVGLFTEAD
jgi:uncharacterized OB-fold protein